MQEIGAVTAEFLNSLPEKTVYIGGKPNQVRVDISKNMIYLLDSTGKYTGKFAKYAQPAATGNSAAESAPAVPLELEPEVASAPELMNGNDQSANSATNEAPKKQWPRLSPIGIALLIISFLCILTILSGIAAGLRQNSLNNATASTDSSSTTTTPNHSGPVTPSDQGSPTSTVTLLSPTKDIFPGDPLNKIQLKPVSIAEYQSLSIATQLYTESDAAYLKDMVATQYIAAGQYLTYDNVGASYSPVSPWATLAPGKASLTIPVSATYQDLTDYLWGNQVELEISVKAWGSSLPETTLLPDGIHAATSTDGSALVTTYYVQGAVIRDVFNNNGKDLYSQYYMTSQLPISVRQDYLSQRYGNTVRRNEDTPAMIAVVLTQEQSDFLSNLNQDRMTVSVDVVAPFCETALQSDLYRKLQDVGQAISDAMRTAQ